MSAAHSIECCWAKRPPGFGAGAFKKGEQTMDRALERPSQDAWEQIALLHALVSELIEEMDTGDASKAWAKVMAVVKQPPSASDR